jgi:hypothetical protein
MELKGHKSQVMAVAFSPDSKRCVTASKDGTLRIWNIDVRYQLEEDPKTLLVVGVVTALCTIVHVDGERRVKRPPIPAVWLGQACYQGFLEQLLQLHVQCTLRWLVSCIQLMRTVT